MMGRGMAVENTPSLIVFETQVRKTTSKSHKKEIELLTSILNMYINGFNSIDSFTYNQDNEKETAWLLLVARSFHSMRSALQLMLMGYYGQAISLLRTITENFFICHDCIKNPKAIEAILHKKYRIPSRKNGLTFYEMAERTGNLRIYRSDYAHQSELTHPSALSLGIIRDPKTNEINVAPRYDKILFLDCCEMMVRDALMMNEFMARLLSKLSSQTEATSWAENAKQTIDEASDWLKGMREEFDNINPPKQEENHGN
jgi:hypothetical protein